MNESRVAFVSAWFDQRKHLRAFLETAKRNGIQPHNADPEIWGDGQDYRTIPWWRKSAAQARFVREHEKEYDYFAFTDSYDLLWAAGKDEILSKFLAYNSPIVFGSERYPWPKPEQAKDYPPCPYPTRFLNAGFWMATTEYAMKLAEILSHDAQNRKQDDQGFCIDLFLSKKLPIALDNKCSLLYCCNMDSLDHLSLENGRIKAVETGEFPCMFHGNGNADIGRLYPWLNLSF